MAEIPPVSERITRRKVIVYKSRVDPTIVKLTAEKMKNRLFVKFGFSKPRPEEIRVVSVDKFYEPYVLVDARYKVDFSRKRVHTLEVDNETDEVEILGQTFKPETVVSPTGESHKVINIETEERSFYEDKAYVILDKTGREVPPDQVPSAPSEDQPQKKLKEAGRRAGKVEFSPREGVEIIRAKIAKRPADADTLEDELFQITEHAVIYSPVYAITFRNVRTGEEKVIRIDGVTAKIVQQFP